MFIENTLGSLAAQTHPNLEILVSDDASSDDTATICERFATHDTRFRVVRRPARLGWIGNANYLLHAARGRYLFFAFHDDPLQPTYVSRLVEALESHPSAVLAFTDVLPSTHRLLSRIGECALSRRPCEAGDPEAWTVVDSESRSLSR